MNIYFFLCQYFLFPENKYNIYIFKDICCIEYYRREMKRSSILEASLGKGVQKIGSKFTGEHPCRSAILIKLQSNFIEITLWHGCSPVNLLHIFKIPFPKNTSGGLLLDETFQNKI